MTQGPFSTAITEYATTLVRGPGIAPREAGAENESEEYPELRKPQTLMCDSITQAGSTYLNQRGPPTLYSAHRNRQKNRKPGMP